MAGRHVEIREIDYAEVLRERKGGEAAAWDQVIANCLQGDAFELNEETIRALLDAAADSEKLAQLMATLDARAAETGRTVAQRTTALLRLLQGIVAGGQRTGAGTRRADAAQPGGRRRPAVARHAGLAAFTARPACRSARFEAPEAAKADVASIVTSVTSRMSDATIAQFVAKNALTPGTSIDRVAQAFHALVQDVDRRERLITMAHDEAAASPFGAAEGFEKTWETVAREDDHVVLGRTLRVGRVRARVVDDPEQGDRHRAAERRPPGAPGRLARHRRDHRAAQPRSDARPRPAAHRGRHRALGDPDASGRRPDRGPAARRRLRRRRRARGGAARPHGRRRRRRSAGRRRAPRSTRW